MHCFYYHQSLLKMVKKSRIPERGSIFLSFMPKFNFSLKVVSLLCFIGPGSNESIQESSEGVTFLSFFLKSLKEIFISEIRTGLCLGVGLGFQYADIEVTDFL